MHAANTPIILAESPISLCSYTRFQCPSSINLILFFVTFVNEFRSEYGTTHFMVANLHTFLWLFVIWKDTRRVRRQEQPNLHDCSTPICSKFSQELGVGKSWTFVFSCASNQYNSRLILGGIFVRVVFMTCPIATSVPCHATISGHNRSLIREQKGYQNLSQLFIHRDPISFIIFIFCSWVERLWTW